MAGSDLGGLVLQCALWTLPFFPSAASDEEQPIAPSEARLAVRLRHVDVAPSINTANCFHQQFPPDSARQ